MSVIKPTPALYPAEKARSSAIHLVTQPLHGAPGVAPSFPKPAGTISKVNVAHTSSRKSEHIRESERISTIALAGAALIAPAIWFGHALLVWLDLL